MMIMLIVVMLTMMMVAVVAYSTELLPGPTVGYNPQPLFVKVLNHTTFYA
jgi:hypothetical protein